MSNDVYEIHLIPSAEDRPIFGREYQEELTLLALKAAPQMQRAYTLDAVNAYGGALGEWVFANGATLIVAVVAVGGTYLNARNGRRVKIKFAADQEIEAPDLPTLEKALVILKAVEAERAAAAAKAAAEAADKKPPTPST